MAEKLYKIMTPKEIQNLKVAVMGGLPAAERKYSEVVLKCFKLIKILKKMI